MPTRRTATARCSAGPVSDLAVWHRPDGYFAFFIASNENTKSCFSSGLWHVKQFVSLALSLTDLSALKAWYSRSPFRTGAM